MRTLILGFDAFDPVKFEELAGQGRLPHLATLAASGGYARFKVSDPPQTEVSWTSIATGLNPGRHGIFDFVHRDPSTYTPYVSLLPTRRGVAGTQFVPPHRACTIFEEAARQGFPATALWWPATFPARPELPVATLPGLGAPDIHGRLGVGTLYTSDPEAVDQTGMKTPVKPLSALSSRRYAGALEGPSRQTRKGTKSSEIRLELEVFDGEMARLNLGKRQVELTVGRWSPIVELEFSMGWPFRFRALTRFLLSQVEQGVRLYALPTQIHPLSTPWRYATPRGQVRALWGSCGPFLTLGMPQDTTGLEDGCLTDDQFLTLCELIDAERERVLTHQISQFQEGLLACVFDSLDRVQHMFWRDRPDIVDEWYCRLDGLVGRLGQQLDAREDTRFLVVSDHGFSRFDYKAHVNRWLIAHSYLAPAGSPRQGGLRDVDWRRSQAYAVGLNSIYLNLIEREGQGSVDAAESSQVMESVQTDLLRWRGPDGRRVVERVLTRDQAFEGPLAVYGPDLVVGFSPGYRASAETGLGRWPDAEIEANTDHWGADHCIDSEHVPGVLFANRDLGGFPHPSYRDFPVLAIGAELPPGRRVQPPVQGSEEDEDALEDRLRSLGYL